MTKVVIRCWRVCHKTIVVVVVVIGLPHAGRYLRAPACLTTFRALSHHMAWTRSSCIAKQDLPTLDFQYTNLTFLITLLHNPLLDTTSVKVAHRSPPIAAHS